MNVISTIIAGISLVWTIFNSVNQSKSSKKILEYKKEVDKSNVTLKNIELKYEKAQNVISEMATKCMVLPYLNLDINKSRIYLMGETANINLMPLKKEPNLNEYIDTEYSSNFHVVYQFIEPNSLFVNDTASCIITIDFDKYSKDVSRKRSTKYNNSISFKVRYTDITGRKYYQAYTLVYDVEIRNGKISNKYPLTQNYTVYPPKEIKD